MKKIKILFLDSVFLNFTEFPDDYEIKYNFMQCVKNKEFDEKLIGFFNQNKPDILFVSPQPNFNPCDLEWIKFLHDKAIIALLWYDSQALLYQIEEMDKYSVVNIILDDQLLNGHNSIKVWTPIKPNKISKEKKDIDVYHFGIIESCPLRKETISYLLNRQIPVFTTGCNSWSTVYHNCMNKYIERSKIVINFSRNRYMNNENLHQLKGRIFESMLGGAMVLESFNTQILKYFNENEDFVFWHNNEDLYKKILHYLENDQERLKITENAKKKMLEQYSIKNWWKQIFDLIYTKFPNKKTIKHI